MLIKVIAEATTIEQLITCLNINPDEVKIIMVNGMQSQPGQVLKDGDRIGYSLRSAVARGYT